VIGKNTILWWRISRARWRKNLQWHHHLNFCILLEWIIKFGCVQYGQQLNCQVAVIEEVRVLALKFFTTIFYGCDVVSFSAFDQQPNRISGFFSQFIA